MSTTVTHVVANGQVQFQNVPYTQPRQVGRVFRDTAIVQIVSGGFALLFGIICTATTVWIPTFSSVLVPGIWGGLLFLATGIVGVVGYSRKTRCSVIAYLTLSIISSPIAGIALIFAIVDLAAFHDYCFYTYPGYWRCDTIVEVIVTCTFLLLIALMELVASIVAAGYCCATGCGTKGAGPNPPNQAVPGAVYLPAQGYNPQQPYYGQGNVINVNAPGQFSSGQAGPYYAGPGGQAYYPQMAQGNQGGIVGPYSPNTEDSPQDQPRIVGPYSPNTEDSPQDQPPAYKA